MTEAASTWVVFDYGGVICTPQPDEDVALLAAAAGVPVPDFQRAYWAYRLSCDRGRAGRHDLLAPRWPAALRPVVLRGRSVAELTRLDIAILAAPDATGTVALIEDLAAAGYPLALLSNAPAEVAEVVADLPVTRAFSHRAFSCFLGSVKPEPECYLAVLAMLGARPAEVVFIDDRPENVAGAVGAGHPRRALHLRHAGAGRAGRARRVRRAAPLIRARRWAARNERARPGPGAQRGRRRVCATMNGACERPGVRHFVANVTHPF